MLVSETSLKWMRYASLQLLGIVVALAPSGTRADDYVLPAGETDTIALADGTATNITSLTVAGALTVTGDGWIQTPTLKLDGGTLTIDGTKAAIGTGHYQNETPTSSLCSCRPACALSSADKEHRK